MSLLRRSIPVPAAIVLAALPAFSAVAEEQPPAEPAENVRICEAYGPGYTLVPGTNTCIKINGFVRQDLNITGGPSSGSASSSGQAPN